MLKADKREFVVFGYKTDEFDRGGANTRAPKDNVFGRSGI